VRLDVGRLSAEELLDPLDGHALDRVHVLAAAVVAASRVPLGVLVGQHGALRLHDGDRREVLRRDHLEGRLLAVQLGRDRGRHLRVQVGERAVEDVGSGDVGPGDVRAGDGEAHAAGALLTCN
jgi:hypothetical protein